MNLFIKPIVVGLHEHCEIGRGSARATCYLRPEFTVTFFNGASDPEADLCYQHTIEMACKYCSEMSAEVRR